MDKSEPTHGKDRGGSCDSLAKLLPEFASLVSNECDENAEQLEAKLRNELKAILVANKGTYHKSCVITCVNHV